MSISTTETVGFCNQFVQLLQDNKDDLKAKGLDVTDWITETNSLKDDAVAKDAEQDAMRAAAKMKTQEAQASNALAYKTTSTRLDAVIGVLGKDTAIAKQASRLRSGLIKQSKPKTDNTANS